MVKKVFLILILINIVMCSANIVQAASIGDILQGADKFVQQGSSRNSY